MWATTWCWNCRARAASPAASASSHKTCGSEPAREDVGPVDINIDGHAAFASRLVPTFGFVTLPANRNVRAGLSRHLPFFSHPVWIIPGLWRATLPVCAITFSLNFWNAFPDGNATAPDSATPSSPTPADALVLLAVVGRCGSLWPGVCDALG